MKKAFCVVLACTLTGLGAPSVKAYTGDDWGTVSEKWNSFWEGVGHDFERAGEGFRETFLSTSDSDH